MESKNRRIENIYLVDKFDKRKFLCVACHTFNINRSAPEAANTKL